MPLTQKEFAALTPEEQKKVRWKDYPVVFKRALYFAAGFIVFAFALNTCLTNSPSEKAKQAKADSIQAADEAFRQKYPNFPRQYESTGVVEPVQLYLLSTLNDPDSYEGVKWGLLAADDFGTFRVNHVFRARNGFGGIITQNWTFILDSNSNVVEVKE